MNFQAKQLLSYCLMASLLFVFVGCVMFCGETDSCEGEFATEISAENQSSFETDHPENACPLGYSADTTVSERVTIYASGKTIIENNSNWFRLNFVFSKAQKRFLANYQPPENLPFTCCVRILRI